MPAFLKTPEDEKRWKRAKKAARQDSNITKDSDEFWALTNYIYQKMTKSLVLEGSRGLGLLNKSISFSNLGTLDFWPKILAVDYDETIHDGKFPEIGDPMPGVHTTLRWYHKHGGEIILWTCREGDKLIEAVRWMDRNKIPFDYANQNVEGLNIETSRKIYADLYIDDRGFFPGWKKLLEMLEAAYRAYGKKEDKEVPKLVKCENCYLAMDIKDEEEAIETYSKQIKELEAQGDFQRAKKLKHILGEEQDHKATLMAMHKEDNQIRKCFIDDQGRVLVKNSGFPGTHGGKRILPNKPPTDSSSSDDTVPHHIHKSVSSHTKKVRRPSDVKPVPSPVDSSSSSPVRDSPNRILGTKGSPAKGSHGPIVQWLD